MKNHHPQPQPHPRPEEEEEEKEASTAAVLPEQKQPWWLSRKKIAQGYIRDARALIISRDPNDVNNALTLVESALALSPRCDSALELKARCLLHLRRYKDIATMLQDHIPSIKLGSGDSSSSSSSDSSAQPLSKERVTLLPADHSDHRTAFKCFSMADLKRKLLAGICKNPDHEAPWRYLILGQACYHLGLMEDAMLLLQTGKRLSSAAFRRVSNSWTDDSFFINVAADPNSLAPPPPSESESTTQLLAQIKQVIRRKTAAIAAMDSGAYAEAVRHFSKIVDSKRGGPQGFLAECYMNRAFAYKSAGRIAESISDCNRTLALDPSCIQALATRSSLLETIRCLPDSLHDLEHLKLLYNSILRDRKLPAGPVWKRHSIGYREIERNNKLLALNSKIDELKCRVANGECGNVDYYGLMGLRRGCSRSELEKANLLLNIKHRPDRIACFIDRCEMQDAHEVNSVKERLKISATLLHKHLQKGYAQILGTILDEAVAEKQRKVAQAALRATALQIQKQAKTHNEVHVKEEEEVYISENESCPEKKSSPSAAAAYIKGGNFCRDLAVVGSLLSQVGFNRPLPVKYEALTC